MSKRDEQLLRYFGVGMDEKAAQRRVEADAAQARQRLITLRDDHTSLIDADFVSSDFVNPERVAAKMNIDYCECNDVWSVEAVRLPFFALVTRIVDQRLRTNRTNRSGLHGSGSFQATSNAFLSSGENSHGFITQAHLSHHSTSTNTSRLSTTFSGNDSGDHTAVTKACFVPASVPAIGIGDGVRFYDHVFN